MGEQYPADVAVAPRDAIRAALHLHPGGKALAAAAAGKFPDLGWFQYGNLRGQGEGFQRLRQALFQQAGTPVAGVARATQKQRAGHEETQAGQARQTRYNACADQRIDRGAKGR